MYLALLKFYYKMKKILVIGIAFIVSLMSINLNAQTIQSVTITSPISCYGDLANINIQVNQTNPPTILKVIVGYNLFGTFIPITSTNNTTVNNINVPGLAAQNYTVRLVDSSSYYGTNPQGSTPGSIYDVASVNITQPLQLTNTAVQMSTLLCRGDCDGSAIINVFGGTPPFSVSFNGGGLTSLSAFDSTYVNLCAGTYSIFVTDANSCSVNASSPTSITINEPSFLTPSGIVSSNFNGQDISCFGANDGEITASVTGGSPPYTYSFDGVNYSSNVILNSLSAGTYTVYYRDANGCDTSELITLSNPPDLSGTIAITQPVSCFGVCDGELEFQVNNILTGTAPYTYSVGGGPFQNSNLFTGLCGNTSYSITIQDVNNCIYNANSYLPEPSQISFSDSVSNYNGFNISCNGLNDGTIHFINPSGGNPPYTYSIDGSTFNTAMDYSGLNAGSYNLVTQDGNGCSSSMNIILNEPNQFTITYSIDNNISCNSICDGGITVSPSNGVNPIIYTLTGYSSQSAQSWTGLCGSLTFGSYSLTASDANGCSSSINISLNEPLPFVYSVDSTPEYCGDSNGTASVLVNLGGTPPYLYLWDDPAAQTTSVASNLADGLYVIRVTDANGCEFLEDILVSEADITLNFDSIPPCNNNNDGSATVYPNGVPPYTYLWSNGSTSNTATGLSPGYYSVTVTDQNNCSVTDSVEIPASSIVDVNLDVINSNLNVNCNGFQSDTITILASGGTGAGTYQYYIPGIFPNPQYNNIFSGLYAGVYDVYAFDANGCQDFVTVTINEPDVIYFSATSSDVSCNSGSDGVVWVDSISGGTAPYFYSWSSGQNTSIVNNLSAGNYTLSVTDVNGCSSNPNSVTVTVNQPSLLTSSTNILNHSSCSGSQTAANGEAEVIVNGGTPGYTYFWSNGSSGDNISLLFPGTYAVQITDANGCTVNDTAIINPGANPQLDVVVQNVSCFGANDGSITTAAISGTPPYLYSFDGGTSFVQNGTSFGPTGGASYYVTVIDDEGCTDSDSIFVNEPDLLEISSIDIQNVLCFDSANGQMTVNIIGGTSPYTYLWNNGQTTQTTINLMPAVYNVTVTDSMGCTVVSGNEIISQPDSLTISSIITTHVSCFGGNNGSSQVTIDGGTQPYSYSWSGGSNSGLLAGAYSVTVTDTNGCVINSNFSINEPSEISIQFIKDSVTCLGGSDGMATSIINGGVSPYSLTWDNGDTTSMVSTFDAGYHTLVVTDFNNCIFMDSVNILEPSESIEIDSLIVSEITCNNANNASITVLATGGSLPYLYSNTNGFVTQNGISFINLSPNQYIIYVRDQDGCVDRDTITIDQPDSIYIDTTIFSHITCYGANDGFIQSISAFGGVHPYLYSVNGGAYHSNMAYFNNYGPGVYTVEVMDSNNCTAQDIIIIEEPDELNVTINQSLWNGFSIKCHGDNSGYIDILVSGGNTPYTKTILDANNSIFYSGTSNNITGFSAGIYSLTVTDNNGCSTQEFITFNEPNPISHNFVIDHITCTGWSNGSITAIISGGVGNSSTYEYLWSTGDSTYSVDSLGIGNYTINVIDENNCFYSAIANINSNSVLSASIGNTQDPTCWNYCDGEIEILANGGVPNINSNGNNVYNYQWNDVLSQTTQTAIGLCVDPVSNVTSFSCTISDALGCVVSQSFILSQPEKLEVSLQQTSDILCFGSNEGSLSATSIGGNSGNVLYSWNTGQSSNSSSLNNLSSGNYVVIASDQLGCTDTTEYFVSQPNLLTADIADTDIIDVDCYGNFTGKISVKVTGGTVNVSNQYIYNWVPNFGNASSSYDFNSQEGLGSITDIDTGIYYVEVTDINGCLASSNIVYVAQPTNPLTIFTDSIDQTCVTEGSATAYVLGGTPSYSYLWSPGGQTNVTANNLDPNTTYVVQVTDDNGCVVYDTTHINGYKNIFLPNNTDSFEDTICYGKSILISVEDQGHDYLWSSGQTTPSITVTPTDPFSVFTLQITDPNCPSSYEVTAIIHVPQLVISPIATPNPVVLGQEVFIESSNNYSSFLWTWNEGLDSATGISISDYPEESQWYYVEATNSIGCKGVDSVYVTLGVMPYDAITPNGDGLNDVWEILDIERYPNAVIQIFNRWGSLIFSSSGQNYNDNKWNGEFENKILPVGTYYYTINLNDNGSELQTGAVTIVR